MVDEMRMSGTLTLGKQSLSGTLSPKSKISTTLNGVQGIQTRDIRLANIVDYNTLGNLPTINTITVKGDKIGPEYGLQNLLTAGNGISIENDAISLKSLILDCGTASLNVGV